jgi:Fe-S-cluster-containing hydrogenase component 2
VLRDYVRQGLYQGQKLLVLDLKSCTRCDECTRACADSHDGNARLLREGLRFGDFLVATSCRSCHKPYCMEGCPVDAIHRRGNHLEVVIENHCIGCGLCERNCPYGAIHMVPRGTPNLDAAAYPEGNPNVTAARRAVNCDLCNGDEPYCVQSCPHEAAYRKSGPALLEEVLYRLDTCE